jgi:hypothetical protein
VNNILQLQNDLSLSCNYKCYIFSASLYSKCATSNSCPYYYRDIIAYVCGGSAVLGLIVLISLFSANIGNRQRASSDLLGRSFASSDRVQNEIKFLCDLTNGIKHS